MSIFIVLPSHLLYFYDLHACFFLVVWWEMASQLPLISTKKGKKMLVVRLFAYLCRAIDTSSTTKDETDEILSNYGLPRHHGRM